MALFGKKTEGGMLDVIRCDEPDYLIWKWHPGGEANSTRKENAIRWGSSLRVKDGEVAVFVYHQESGPNQDYIEGPFDEVIKTANLPVLSSLIGLAYAGQSPFQAEVYFINLAGIIKVDFRIPYFDVFDPRFLDFPVRLTAGGSYTFNITDYKRFIKQHRLIHFDQTRFASEVRDAVNRYIKNVITNAPSDNGLPVLQLERKIFEINELVTPKLRSAFETDFAVNLLRLDLSLIEVNKDTPEYTELRRVTADLEIAMRQKQNEVNMKNLEDTQAINAGNLEESLRIQREQAERQAALQTQTQFIGAHQINQQTEVLKTAASSLGSMGQMNLGGGGGGEGGGGGGGGGFNPVGVMTGLAIGGAMGGQMAGMMNHLGQSMQQPMMTPPPIPQVAWHVSINGQPAGPFNPVQLQELVRNGQLTPQIHVWKAGMANWELAGNIPELAMLFAPPAPPPPPPPPVG